VYFVIAAAAAAAAVGEMALVASVLGTSAAQQQLVPALMRVYGQADFVVGLDVDVHGYDKFTVRARSSGWKFM
jgi:hypothetical protein